MTNDDRINFELIWGTARGHRVIIIGFCPPLNQHNNRTINLEVWPGTKTHTKQRKKGTCMKTTRGIEMKIGRRWGFDGIR